MAGIGRSSFLSLRREWSRCWVFLMTALVLTLEVNLSVRWTPRNLTLCTISTSWPLMDSGRWCRWLVFLKSTTSSFVLLLRERLRLLHHSVNCATSRLYADSSLLVMRPTTVVLSANFMIWLVLKLAEQSCVSNVNNKGLSTHPCGDPVLTVIILDVVLTNRTVCCLCQKVQNPSAYARIRTQQQQLFNKLLWQDCNECRAKIN